PIGESLFKPVAEKPVEGAARRAGRVAGPSNWTYIGLPRIEHVMATENFSTRFQELDSWPSLDILSAFYEGQLSAVAAVRPALPAIAAAAEDAAARLRRGGRLVYVGAGTSGRIGVQDGAELPPTFDWPE